MTKENNFDNMMASALSNVDETLEDIKEKQDIANPYNITQALLDEGFLFDYTGAYFPYKEEFQAIGVKPEKYDYFMENHARDDIYLWASRNPDKKLELNCKWARKTSEGFIKSRGFNLDFTLDIGDEKTLKALNKKVSFSGGKNGNPASEGSYVSFVDYFTTKIIENDCLEVLKENSFEFPEVIEDEDVEDVELDNTPQCFSDYPEKVQHEAMQILEDGKLFEEMQKSISLTHEGHKTTRNALILMESSLFVDDGAHGLIGGASGGGKTDIALTCALNLPEKNVHIISSNSPKDIFYDFDSYDDDFNILIFDDVLMTEELIKLCKLLTDNRVKDKVHKTVINGKSEKFKLKGKYEVIITYAKTLPDEELANRLFNIGVNIVDEGESEERVKGKILDNKVTKGNDNALIKDIRAPIQAGVQYLIEQDMKVYNPYLSMYNPINYNNRDINHLASMTNARTFFEYTQRRKIKVNENLFLTIGSYEDLNFVHDIWARDEEAQKYKLSELQKQCLELLPEMTDNEAFQHVEELNLTLKSQSRAYKKKVKDDEPLLKPLAKKLKCNPSTLKHALDRFSEGNQKSLCEIGLVDKIQLDENNSKSPNFYYKVKHEGKVSNLDESIMQDKKIKFAYSIESSIVKQKIILDLLIYANIIINERGLYALKTFCENYKEEIDVEDYNQLLDFLQSFFDGMNYDEYVIRFEDSSRDDKLKMFEFKEKLNIALEKKRDTPSGSKTSKICTSKNQEENSSKANQSKNKNANINCTLEHIFRFEIKEQLEEINVDVEIAHQVYELLTSGAKTLQEITNSICEGLDPEDFNEETTPLKIEMNVERLYMSDYLDFNAPHYELQESFVELVETAKGDGSC